MHHVVKQMLVQRLLVENTLWFVKEGSFIYFGGVRVDLKYYCRLVAIARGEQEYFDPSGIPTATEACKSNALMRCCKDLGIASELW